MRGPRVIRRAPPDKAGNILWIEVIARSALAAIACGGRSGWKGRCAPQASSTIRGTSWAWAIAASVVTSEQAPV